MLDAVEAKPSKVLEKVNNTSELHNSLASDNTSGSVLHLTASILIKQKEK